MKVGKPISKRTPVRLRHKIQKASAAKQRKARKDEKKNPQWRSRLKKDPGIPNLFPFKAQILAEVEEKKREKEAEKMRRREVARAQRVGDVQEAGKAKGLGGDLGDEELIDHTYDDEEEAEDEEMDGLESGENPMAALLASAQARANRFEKQEESGEDDEEDGEGEEWGGIQDKAASEKAMPKRVLEDPIKAVTKLVERMQGSSDAMQRMMDFYQIPPLVTAGKDFTTRYLVEVARKRGRLGRGGVPNLHSAALTVLSDLHESRLVLPATETKKMTTKGVADKGEVQIVKTMAAPFTLEGLWGDESTASNEMEVE